MSGIEVSDPADPRLADYTSLTDPALRRAREPAEGVFVAEGEKVLRRALAAGYPLRSVLLHPRWLEPLADVLEADEAPAYVATAHVLERVTGYRVHRGPLAAMGRKPLPGAAALLRDARRVLVLEDLNDPANLGAVFRSAAALGIDAALLSPRCADPLYRRAVKASMGAVLTLPYTRLPAWPEGLQEVRAAGLQVLALTPAAEAMPLPALAPAGTARLALLLGAEGPGLSPAALAAADLTVRIPMGRGVGEGVDSLNVAAAAAIACYAVGTKGGAGQRAG